MNENNWQLIFYHSINRLIVAALLNGKGRTPISLEEEQQEHCEMTTSAAAMPVTSQHLLIVEINSRSQVWK